MELTFQWEELEMHAMTPKEAGTLLSLAGDFHAGRIQLPPEIMEIDRKIAVAKHKAFTFFVRLGAVDMSLMNDVVRLMHEKDSLYAEWACSETPSL
jgi:hypothetical protein